ncbi:MAG: DPP IV N-terminal domain-containing protein, partial [Muribaculaceae bacterium]|nr:DPP IV N-terminal domain-containing protein [Muribaculaceae bacterium]
MKKFFAIICVAAVALTTRGADPIVERIRPYVYPQSVAPSPSKMVYAPDGLSYYQIADDGAKINRYDTNSGALIETTLDVTHTRNASIGSVESFTLSPDGSKMLVYEESTPIYRRSFKAPYYVFEIKRNILKPLSSKLEQQQIPLFSPDGRMVAFVAEGNIIVKKLDYDNEVVVTADGAPNIVRNGLPDWTYEEEFGATSAMTWSPDNEQLCFLKFNEHKVPTYSMTIYQGDCNPQPQYALYPGEYRYKYPVAGEANSVVSLHVYDVENRTIKEISLGGANPEYIPRITYAYSPERLMVVTLNRAQNQMDVYSVNPKSTVSKNILTERSATWISPASYEEIDWQDDGWVMQSERSGYNHLYKYSYAGALQRQITSGDWNVTAYYGKDAAGNHYFQSTSTSPLDRTVEMIDAKGSRRSISPASGTSSAVFSPAMNTYMLSFYYMSTTEIYTLYN